MQITQLIPARIDDDGTPEMMLVTTPSQKQAQPIEELVVRGILTRAENHLAYLQGSGASEATLADQRHYIEAVKPLLTRLY